MLKTTLSDVPVATLTDRRSEHRRRHARATLRWPVTVISGDSALHGLTENVSRGGAFLLLSERLVVQNSIRLAIEIPDCQDVITAGAIVVRSGIAPKDAPDHLQYAVGVEFTKISADGLKFFSGNLAPEWEKDANEMETAQPTDQKMASSVFSPYLIIALLVAVVSLAAFSIIKTNSVTESTAKRLTELDANLKQIELQLQNLHVEVSAFKTMQEAAKMAFAQQAAGTEKNDALVQVYKQDIPRAQDTAQQTPDETAVPPTGKVDAATAITAPVREHAANHSVSTYYVVKPGDNLFRIGLKNNLTSEQIRKLNNLTADYAIRPGQKLRVQ
jgi:LysM repeat protein